MQAKTKAFILGILENKSCDWMIRKILVSAYFHSLNQDNEIRQAVAETYAKSIVTYIKSKSSENIDDIENDLIKFFYTSIYYYKIPSDFFRNILRESKLEDAAVKNLINNNFITLYSYSDILKGKPNNLLKQAEKVNKNEQQILLNYVEHNPKIFHFVATPQFVSKTANSMLICFVAVLAICLWYDLSIGMSLFYAVLAGLGGVIAPQIPDIVSINKSMNDALIKFVKLSLRVCDEKNSVQYSRSVPAPSQSSQQDNSEPVILCVALNNESAISANVPSLPILNATTTSKRKKSQSQPNDELPELPAAINNEPLTPSFFDSEYSSLKAKYLVKVEGQGLGLSSSSNLYLLWDKTSIKRGIKPRDKEEYKNLKKLYLDTSTAPKHSRNGLKYVPIFGLYILKGENDEAAYGDKILTKEKKSAIVLSHIKSDGFNPRYVR